MPFVPAEHRASWDKGWAAGRPYGIVGFLLSMSFGVLAVDAGFPAWGALLFSMIVFAGSAQFASLAVISAGGGVGPALVSATLVNSRFLPMGVALAPSLPGGWIRRALQGQPVVDSSWAMAAREDGTFDRWFLFGSTGAQYVGWTGGTAFGAFGGDLLGDPSALGLDAIFPTFFLVLLFSECKTTEGRVVALAGGLIAVALVPLTPVGVPVLVASLAALMGLRGARDER